MSYVRIVCPKCSASFAQEVRFLDHLTDLHGVSDHEALYVETVLNGVKPTCGCGCLSSTPWNGWKKGYSSQYVRGHNARVDSVYLDKEKQKQFTEKRVEGFKSGRNKSWNVGLTKETDERVKSSAQKISTSLNAGYASGSIVDWRILDPEKAALQSKKQSKTMLSRYASGDLVPWNLGETKETNPIIAEVARKISLRYKFLDAGHRIKIDELKKRIGSFSDKFTLLSDLSEYSTRRVKRLKFQCTTCNAQLEKSLAMLEETPICHKCHPKESKGQLELFEFVKSIAPDAVLSDRTVIAPKELDVYIPSKRLGIEYDGLYYHSEECVDDDYAYNKSNDAAANNVSLFGVFEDEWRDKQDLVKSMIIHRLGKTPKSVFARKCKIVELSPAIRKQFMDRCHIDGDTRSKSAWGLVDKDNNIVAAMSIRRPFHKTHSDVLEVGRFCVERGVSVPGALAKLSAHILKEIKSLGYRALMTYVDTRIGQAKGYQAAGFKVIRQTKARFWWTDFVNRFDRFSIRADSKNGITQKQRALDAGVVKIWGCSNVVLELS